MWKRGNAQDEDFMSIQSCRKLAEEEKLAGYWINIGREWFTPEEFETMAENSLMLENPNKTNINFNEVKIKDPRPIVGRMQAEIQKMIDKKEAFEKRVRDYYKKS